MAKSKVDELTEQIDERAQFIVEEHGNPVYVHYTSGSTAVNTDSELENRYLSTQRQTEKQYSPT